MSSSKYFVWGGGRWREVDISCGTVAGWSRRARFVYVRRGRLRVARNNKVLAALRALTASLPSAAALGPRLSQYVEKKPRVHSPRSRRHSSEARCSHHHYCCGHHHGCNNNIPSKSFPALLPQRCDVATQHVITEEEAEPDVQPPSPKRAPPRAPPLHSLLEEPTTKHSPTKTNNQHISPTKKTISTNEPKHKTREAPRSKPKSRSSSCTTSPEVCKELTISESDVAALRSFVARTRSHALERFDADLSYKRALFYAINPLVSVPRCVQTERALTQNAGLPHFAARLGLHPHPQHTEKETEKRARPKRHASRISLSTNSSQDTIGRAGRAVLDNISPNRKAAQQKPAPRKSTTQSDSSNNESFKRNVRTRTTPRSKSNNVGNTSSNTVSARKRPFRAMKADSMEDSDSDFQHKPVKKYKEKQHVRLSRGKSNNTVEDSDETKTETSSISDSESDRPLKSNRRESRQINVKSKRNVDAKTDTSEDENNKENKKLTPKKAAAAKSVKLQESGREGRREDIEGEGEERRVSLRKRPVTPAHSSTSETVRASARRTVNNKSYVDASSSESDSPHTITLARSKSVDNPPKTNNNAIPRASTSGAIHKNVVFKPQGREAKLKRNQRGRFLKVARRRIVNSNIKTQTSPQKLSSSPQKQASSGSSAAEKQASSGSSTLRIAGSSGDGTHKQGKSGSEQHTHIISKRSSASNTKEYSNLEDHAIVSWISSGARARQVNGNRVWRELQDSYLQLTGRSRSWHSLRNRYLRYILPGLGALRLPPQHESRLRAAAATGEIKSKRNGVTSQARRNSIFKQAPVSAASSRRPPAASTPNISPDRNQHDGSRRRSTRMPLPAAPRTRKLYNPKLVL